MIKFRFTCLKKVNFGQAVYISGNIPQLGSWKPQNALELKCYSTQNWFCDIQLPLQTFIEYKFFVANYIQNVESEKPAQISQWIGTSTNQNLKLFISKDEGKLIDHQRKTKQLRVMSFNVRAQNPSDTTQYSWDTRKQNCIKLIKQQLPSIIGFQEANPKQKSYLKQNLLPLYQFLDCGLNQGFETDMCMLYNRQRFLEVQSGVREISQQNLTQSVGSQKWKPKHLQFVILQDTYTSSRFRQNLDTKSSKNISELPRELFFVGNLYLDFHSTNLQKNGLLMMNELIKQKSSEYKDELRDVFVLGDFNLPENSHLMHSFEKGDVKMQSIRKNFLRRHMADCCDLGYTFQEFQNDLHDIQNPNKIIDHLFISTQDYEPTKFQVIRSLTQKGKHNKKQIFSDHYPIMGVFKHKKPLSQKNI